MEEHIPARRAMLPTNESFVTVQGPRDRTVFRGVSLTPGTDTTAPPHPGCGPFCPSLPEG